MEGKREKKSGEWGLNGENVVKKKEDKTNIMIFFKNSGYFYNFEGDASDGVLWDEFLIFFFLLFLPKAIEIAIF